MLWWVGVASSAELQAKWDDAFPIGATAFVAGDAVNLRAAPALDGAVVVELPLGSPVDVIKVGSSGTVGSRTAPWVQVRSSQGVGWLFSGVLTPARLEVDLDGDGTKEIAVLAFRTDQAQVLRIKEAGGKVQELDFGENPDIDGASVQMSLSATTAAETGIPMLKAFWPGREMCGSGTHTRWVSFVGDRARLAIEGSDWADAPAFDSVSVVFTAAKLAATVTHKSSSDDENGPDKVEVKHLVLKDAVFSPKPK